MIKLNSDYYCVSFLPHWHMASSRLRRVRNALGFTSLLEGAP